MPDPLPVVFVTTVFDGVDTGPATYANYLWQVFAEDPHIDFHVVAPEFTQRHPRLHAAGAGKGSLELYRRVQDTARDLARQCGRACIVHGNSTHSMGRLVDLPGRLIVQVNDYETADVPRQLTHILRQHGSRRLAGSCWRYWNERRVLRRTDLALCNSAYTAEVVSAAYAIAPARVRVLHKAVDTSGFRRPDPLPPDPLPVRASGLRLLFVGSDWQRKGLDLLLLSIAQMLPRMPALTLTVLGPDRDDARLSALVANLGLAQCVQRVGRAGRDDLAAHLWHADVFVLPSRREALGVALLEAMAAGIPVVAAAAGGIPEIVRNADEGVLVQPEGVDELAAAIGQLLADPSRRTALSLAGVRRARDFSTETMTRALRATYFEVAAMDQGG